MDVLHDVTQVREFVGHRRRQGRRIGCVPTMGALHSGHVSLIDECRKHVDETVVTIFVNPTQFGQGEDFDKYPRPLDADLAKCRSAGASCVYLPDRTSLYPVDYDTWVQVDRLTRILEGECRPSHFRGVTTIVCKLFNIVQADVACFGAKDYQQQTVIRRMVRDLNIPTEIVVCPTIREPDGLAMSSRNVYLSKEERQVALSLSRALRLAEDRIAGGVMNLNAIEEEMQRELTAAGVRVQYAVIRHPDTLEPLTAMPSHVVALIAGFVGQTRLIDNLTIRVPESPA